MRANRIVLVALALAAAAGCSGRTESAVVVGSKNFTEQRVLGEIVAQTLEAAGMKASRKLDLGGTFVCDAALRSGEIDVYVEYTGTALGAILKDPAPPPDAATALARLRTTYAAHSLVWTAPLGFDNRFALVVRDDVQERTLVEAIEPARQWKAAFGYEFRERADGYPALERVYGLRFAGVTTMDLGLLYRALVDRQVDVVVGSATDAAIARFPIHVLEDVRGAFGAYEAVPVVRRAALQAHPKLEPALNFLAGKLDVHRMRKLNAEVEAAGRAPADVARDFLVSITR